ncbi:hypothetical protein ACFV0T_31655 [Streptomyces sp. NPDC059582]|uniref:LppU/SCO3897 family protein n=1 Tax=Streptomyces sp. NPDC059582 TaxID=3346875 RepID=UPI0036B48AF8
MTTPPPPGLNPYNQPATPVPARRLSVKGVLKGVVGVVVAGVVVYGGYTTWFGGAATADAGDCLHAANTEATAVISVGDPEFEIVDCGTPEAQFKVASRASGTDGTCDSQYQRYTQGGAGRDFTLCLEPLR